MLDPAQLERLISRRPDRIAHVGDGAAGAVHRLHFADGSTLIAKSPLGAALPPGIPSSLLVESQLLQLLAARSVLPVPRVIHAAPDLLIMQDMPGGSSFDVRSERHAAELLAGLHATTSPDARYGLELDGFIGPLPQPNSPTGSWREFFRQRRLLHMTDAAAAEGALPARLASRLHRLAGSLNSLVPDRPPPSLIHGDIWSGNVLAQRGRITAFLDPAAHYAHAEVELAFITLFSTFGRVFFDRYHELRPIDPAFWTSRRHLYNLCPLLVHVRIYGGSYLSQLDSTLATLGF